MLESARDSAVALKAPSQRPQLKPVLRATDDDEQMEIERVDPDDGEDGSAGERSKRFQMTTKMMKQMIAFIQSLVWK